MSSHTDTALLSHTSGTSEGPVQPAWLGVTHWLNVLAVLVMVMSGWRIYDASPIFNFSFPVEITLGGWLGGALLWHFAAMWLLVANGLVYLAWNLGSGRMKRRFFPLAASGVLHDALAAFRGRLSHTDARHYNQVQRLAELRAMAQTDQITRHICVEGWSAIGRWGGVRFSDFLRRVGADTTARYVGFKCADEYYTSIDMPTALHPQTLLALTYDGHTLPREYGFPMKLRIPTKLGYKNPKHIRAIYVTNAYPGGYWEDQGYNWFGGS